MPQYQINDYVILKPDGRIFAMFVGDSASGKNCAMYSLPKPLFSGPVEREHPVIGLAQPLDSLLHAARRGGEPRDRDQDRGQDWMKINNAVATTVLSKLHVQHIAADAPEPKA